MKQSNLTLMAREAAETPQRLIEQQARNANALAALASRLRRQPPSACMMIGRGTSDHAGVFGKYLIEIELGIPVFSAAPSVATLYGRTLNLNNVLAIAISQSGRSPDIVSQVQHAKDGGAYCVVMVNDEHSPLAQLADCVLPLCAGPEKAVAATKSYLCSLSILLALVAEWKNDSTLKDALQKLPRQLMQTISAPRQLNPTEFLTAEHIVVLGRGLGFAISKEMALKLKETCSTHAESFSSAEFLHGPVALANRPLTVIDIELHDESFQSHRTQLDNIKSRGVDLANIYCPTANVHPRSAALHIMQRFYLDVADLAVAKGYNPDAPTGLKKVTETL